MMRSLWTGASGMRSQQTAVDTIANNLANVNTTAFKTQNTQFKSLLYQTLQAETTTSNANPKPTSAQVGLGARVAAINITYTQGVQLASDNPMSVFISGSGFFAVSGFDGQTYYTRDGDFGWAMETDGTRALTNHSGLHILDVEGNPIKLPEGAGADAVTVGKDGAIGYMDDTGNLVMTGQSIALYQFENPVGLEKVSGNLVQESEASGAPINEATTDLNIIKSTMAQGYLEGSNVNVADEMVNLIITQRAYELNSKAITTSDSMLDTANGLKR